MTIIALSKEATATLPQPPETSILVFVLLGSRLRHILRHLFSILGSRTVKHSFRYVYPAQKLTPLTFLLNVGFNGAVHLRSCWMETRNLRLYCDEEDSLPDRIYWDYGIRDQAIPCLYTVSGSLSIMYFIHRLLVLTKIRYEMILIILILYARKMHLW